MSRVGDLVVDAGVVLLVTFDGRQSLIGDRATQEPMIPTIAAVRRACRRDQTRRRRYTSRKPRPTPWGQS